MHYNYILNLICKTQWVWIFLGGHIQFFKIYIDYELSILLDITTIGDNQLASFVGCINLTNNSLFMSCLIAAT
jgi:hypothetical protein